MSLLNDLSLIGNPTAGAINTRLITDLRADMADDDITPSGNGTFTVGDANVNGDLNVGGDTVLGGAIVFNSNEYTSGATINVALTDTVILVNKAVGSPTSVVLPDGAQQGQVVIVKDKKGDALTNNIAVTPTTGTIDGSNGFTMTQNYQSTTFLWNGDNWSII